MSNINILDTETSEVLSLSSQAIDHIRVMAKWGKFLSIVGFVFIGLMVLVALFAGAFISRAGGVPGISSGVITIIYLFLAALYLYPTWQLYHFSSKAKSSIARNSTLDLTEGLQSLKSIFVFFGIFTAIILGFYALMILIGIIGVIGSMAF